MDRESRRASRRSGDIERVTERLIERVKLRPLFRSLSLAILGGVCDTDRPRGKSRVRDGDRDPEYEDPVYEEKLETELLESESESPFATGGAGNAGFGIFCKCSRISSVTAPIPILVK